jgi:GcrA cell cycle regulator
MSERAGTFDWNDAVIQSLRQFWHEGHSTAEIGRRLGVSKNAVVGKAHRLDLPERPSPIRRPNDCPPRRPSRPPVPKLADIMPLTTIGASREGDQHRSATRATPAVSPFASLASASHRKRGISVPSAVGKNPCCWPIGEPGSVGFRFCSDSALPGKPYCLDHAKLAYRRQQRRGDDKLDAAD